MKNYSNYIFEAKNPDFNIAYNDIENKLNEFWVSLDDSLDILGEIKTRDPNEVSKENSKVSSKTKLVMPVAGETYNYITQNNKHEVVVIIEPNAQDKDKTALPNTAIVKTTTPPTNTIHPADWARLVPTKQSVPTP